MPSGRRRYTTNNIIWTIPLSLLLLFALTTGINGKDVTTIAPPAVIGYSNSPSWWPWIIADSEKFLEKNRVNAELKWYDNYSDSVSDLNSGFIDGNSQVDEDTRASSPKAVKGKIGILLNAYSNGEDKLIVRDSIQTIEDLKGKTIIAESATATNDLLSLVINSHESEIYVNDIEVINLETGSASAAFAANEEIDGVISFAPYSIVALERKNSHELLSSKDFPREIARMLVVTKDISDKRPKLAKQLTDVWFQSLDFIQKHPQKANQIITQRIGIEADWVSIFQEQIQLVRREEATASKVLAYLRAK